MPITSDPEEEDYDLFMKPAVPEPTGPEEVVSWARSN